MLHLLFGKRLLKTALSVFITAQICYLLDWPMIFAVISAIVSIEPTVNDSVRKGYIRLPSAAIGAAFAMIYDAWLGPQPITFTLSALSTIYVCNLLRWNHTIVISTLTAVNMISVSEAHYLTEFFVRLGTTATGIIVSASVNYFVFPPDYFPEIRSLLRKSHQSIVSHARQVLSLQFDTVDPATSRACLDKIETLLGYQLSDYRHKRMSFASLRELVRARRHLHDLRRTLFYMQFAGESMNTNEVNQCLQLLQTSVQQLESLNHRHKERGGKSA